MMTRSITAAVGAIAFGILGAVAAAAADIPTPQAQTQFRQVRPPPPNYNAGPPVAEGYGYPPPDYPPLVAYGYPPPPPSYYEYGAPPVVIMPRPYYWGRPDGPVYSDHPYGVRGYGPYVAHGYGRYDHPWGHGYRGWQ
jgi:hypothetical protein